MAKKKDDAPKVAPVPIDIGTVTTYPLMGLKVSPHNARKDLDPVKQDELTASIKAHGILQSLIGHMAQGSTDDPTTVFVCGGQRRLISLQRLLDEGYLSDDARVPIRILPEDQAIEASLAENLERNDMTPAEEFRAFKALIDTGRYDTQLVADRFGLTKSYVDKRMRLASLSPVILAALDEGKFGIESAMAYAAAVTIEQQEKLFKAQERASYQKHKPSEILSAINNAGLDADGPIGKFLGGPKAYEKAGGTFDTSEFDDLFATELYRGQRNRAMADSAIVKQLWIKATDKASKALQVKAEETFGMKVEGVLWADKAGTETKPKAPKETFKVSWDNYSYNGDPKAKAMSFLEKVKAEGGRVWAAGQLSYGANPVLANMVFVSKDMQKHWDALAKESEAQRAKAEAAYQKKQADQQVNKQAALMFWRTLSAEDKIARCRIDRMWPDGDVSVHLTTSILADEFKPFVKDARAELKAKAEEEARQAAEQQAKDEEEQKAARLKELAEVEAYNATADAIVNSQPPPEVIELSVKHYDTEVHISATKVEAGWEVSYPKELTDEGAPALETISELDDVVQIFGEYADSYDGVRLAMYVTFADYEAEVMARTDVPFAEHDTPDEQPGLDAPAETPIAEAVD